LANITVRRFEQADLDFAYEMLLAEEWNDRREDAERMLGYEPEGCFVAEVDQERVGHIFSVGYGTLAWIGYVIVKAEYRNRGIATLMMRKTLDYLRCKYVQTVKLEAVPEIADLYRNLGFIDEYDSLRFSGTTKRHDLPKNSKVKSVVRSQIPKIAKFDANYFGADRTKVLSKLFDDFPDLCFVAGGDSDLEGFALCRKAESGYKLGPWGCKPENLDAAEQLLAACLSATEPNSRIFIGTPAPNQAATNMLKGYGFELYSRSIRMYLGKRANERIEGIFAIGGPMKG